MLKLAKGAVDFSETSGLHRTVLSSNNNNNMCTVIMCKVPSVGKDCCFLLDQNINVATVLNFVVECISVYKYT